MKPAIDHVVLCVHDLAGAAAFYQRLGFTMTPRGVHPWGTANHLAQLQGSFIELLAIDDARRIVPPEPGTFSFGAFNAGFLARREGMSMLVFASDDARSDQRAFAASGLATYAPFDFSRQARLPNGGEATVGFSLAFVTDPDMPDAAFFACQQHAPQHFWKPDYQRHANGARAIREVMMVADAPERAAAFLSRLTGRAAATSGTQRRIALDGGAIAIMDPAVYRARCGGVAPAGATGAGGPHFVGVRIAVADVAAAEARLKRNDVPYRRAGEALQVDAFGALIELGQDE
jgi:catechol 2,3-dioxygenase-like lactoylglutathione lyase family enzyme